MFRYFRRQSVSASIEGEPESLSRNRDRHVTRRSGGLVGQLLPWAYFTVARYPGARLAIGAVFTPVLAKHSKSFSLIDCISVGVDRMRRNSEPMRKQVEAWQRSDLSDATAKVVMYEGFVEGKLEVPTSPAQCATSTSSRDTKHSGHERSGVSRMHSHRRSRNSIPFRNSERQRSWESSGRVGSRKLFEEAWRCQPDRRPFITGFCRQALQRRPTLPHLLNPHSPFMVSLRMADHALASA
jgi:hypothetical protein